MMQVKHISYLQTDLETSLYMASLQATKDLCTAMNMYSELRGACGHTEGGTSLKIGIEPGAETAAGTAEGTGTDVVSAVLACVSVMVAS